MEKKIFLLLKSLEKQRITTSISSIAKGIFEGLSIHIKQGKLEPRKNCILLLLLSIVCKLIN